MDCCTSDGPAPDAPLACSLQGGDLADRQGWLAHVQRRALAVERSADGMTLRFSHAAGLEAELRALAKAEAECCGFLRLGVRRLGDSLELAVAGPVAAQPIIDEMFGSQS
jgi:hypothetical protein